MISNQIAYDSLFSNNHILVQSNADSVAIDAISNTVILEIIATKCKTTNNSQSGSKFESGDEAENDDESLQDAYEKMYTQWLRVYTNNCAWVRKNQER